MSRFDESRVWIWPADLEHEFEGANDRAIAIIAATFLDTILEMILREFLIDRKPASGLFDPYKPLSTFAAKVHVSYCLGLISEVEFKNLEIIRSIRNSFAHDLTTNSFEDQSINDQCKNLRIPERMYVPEKLPFSREQGQLVIDLTPPNPDQSLEIFRATFFYLQRSLSWRWLEARRNQRTLPEDLESAADLMRKLISESDTALAQLRALEEQAEQAIIEILKKQKEGTLPNDFPVEDAIRNLSKDPDFDKNSADEFDYGEILKITRPLIEITIELLEQAYDNLGENSDK